MVKCMKCRVSGLVQGVSFRYFTREQARRYGVAGWVRNMTDGRVELVAQAEASRLVQFLKTLEHGPPLAQVDRVDCQDHVSDDVPLAFEIRR
ncbi:acylphosphatase [Desulfovibrio inopinatus]|uniref:acylphosphatase n=1 Tax=Desulfovibrio inopinatus TaxID=102109 RepID=UPI0004077F63|nr:acylphosphatase [Desulfovibrio inopinatus]